MIPSVDSSGYTSATATSTATTNRVPVKVDVDGGGGTVVVDELEHVWHGKEVFGTSDWAVQGFDYNEATNQFFTTYYSKETGEAILSIQDGATGEETAHYVLDGLNKAGGVSSDDKFLYVSNVTGDGEATVHAYSLESLETAGTTHIKADQVTPTEVGSTITVNDGIAYVAQFGRNPPGPFGEDDRPYMHMYKVNEDGTLGEKLNSVPIPYEVQGIEVTDQGVLLVRSYGEGLIGKPHEVMLMEFDGSRTDFEHYGDAEKVAETAPYAEGADIVGDELWISNEGGSTRYKGDDGIPGPEQFDLDDLDG